MSKQAILKINAVGYRTFFLDSGEPVVFKNGVCKLTEEQMDNEQLQKWLQREHKACGITQMTDAEIAEMEDAEQADAKRKEAAAIRQSQVNAILAGRDPELIEAVKPTVATVSTSVADKIAVAKAAAQAASKTK